MCQLGGLDGLSGCYAKPAAEKRKKRTRNQLAVEIKPAAHLLGFCGKPARSCKVFNP